MDRGNVFSGGAFRVTLYATAVLVVLCSVIAFVGYRYIQDEQLLQLRTFLSPTAEGLRLEAAENGVDEFIEQGQRLAKAFEQKARLIAVYDSTGRQIVGSPGLVPDFEGWAIRPVAIGDGGEAEDYCMSATDIAGMTVVVGAALVSVHRIENTLIRTLFSITAFLAMIFIALGYGTSRVVQSKLEGIENALERVGDGDRDVRLPVFAANDQIDRVARRMNVHLDTFSGLMFATKSSAATIAHDLKRPLARALLGVDRALAQAGTGADPQAALEDTRHELANLTRIFETILRIARIDAGHGEGLKDTVDLADLARDLGETFQVVAEESGQSLTITAPDGPALVRGDAGMLSQMLVNLLHNCRIPDGSMAVS